MDRPLKITRVEVDIDAYDLRRPPLIANAVGANRYPVYYGYPPTLRITGAGNESKLLSACLCQCGQNSEHTNLSLHNGTAACPWCLTLEIGPHTAGAYAGDHIPPYEKLALRKKGEVLTIGEWSRRSGTPAHVIYFRYNRLGWSACKSINGLRKSTGKPRSPTIRVDYQGRQYTLTELAVHLGITRGALINRLNRGLPLTDPMQTQKKYEYQGRYYTAKQLGRKLKLSPNLIRERARRGKALDAPLAVAHKYEYQGGMYTIRELAKLLGVKPSTLKARIVRGIQFDFKDKAIRYDVGDGRKLSVSEIANATGITRDAIYDRIRSGWTGARLLDPNSAKREIGRAHV